MSQIVLKPIVTEKMTTMTENLNRYGFLVSKEANKIEIKEAIEKLYDVKVDKIWTIRYAGKTKSRYTKTGLVTGKSAAYKKAIVTVAEGEAIDIYSNI
jgi:large subunit ribosomal protein L23